MIVMSTIGTTTSTASSTAMSTTTTQRLENDDSNNNANNTSRTEGEIVRVVIVPKPYTKCIKTSLEQHQLLNRNFRISNVVDHHHEYTSTNPSSSFVAIPIWNNPMVTAETTTTVVIPCHTDTTTTNDKGNMNDDNDKNKNTIMEDTIETLVSNIILDATSTTPIDILFGYQFCLYSSRVLGNHHQQQQRLTNPHHSFSIGIMKNDNNKNNNNICNTYGSDNQNNISIVQSILIHAISKFLSRNQTIQELHNDVHDKSTSDTNIATTTRTPVTTPTLGRHDPSKQQQQLLQLLKQLYHDVTTCLNTEVCPPKLEWWGDDRTIVLPRNALTTVRTVAVQHKAAPHDDDATNHPIQHHDDNNNNNNNNNNETDHNVILSFSELLQRYGITSAVGGVDVFLQMDLWPEMARTFRSHRIVRRDEIHPDSPIRQSHYQIVWYDPNYYYNDLDDSPKPYIGNTKNDTSIHCDDTKPNQSPKLASCRWITVTEQGIRQSFDMTKVMFSRGNISEKIRYGTQLVQTDDVILDMYAGIGYFTLPALIHGNAKHVFACEWNPDAIAALKRNVQDNHVSDRVTIMEGDCRIVIRDNPTILQNRFDRISLGLLPSSEGGWPSAILALRKDIGGWLHIHGNVPQKEVEQWSRWLAQSLHKLLMDPNNHTTSNYIDWMVLVVHVEKVKSFAPNVYHYVADVFIGPVHCFPGRNGTAQWPKQLSEEWLERFLDDHRDGGGGCIVGVYDLARQCIDLCPTTAAAITPPSCALSPYGPLHQT